MHDPHYKAVAYWAFFDELEKIGAYISGYFRDDGTFVKGHQREGIPISIERAKGTTRSGRNRLGESWSRKTTHHYGFIPGTKGADGEEVDVYVGPGKSKKVFVVHQLDPAGKSYDEDKVMLGFESQRRAEAAFKENSRSDDALGSTTPMTLDDFKKRLEKKRPLIDAHVKRGLEVRLRAKRTRPTFSEEW